jgi:L,D-transpeptidase ErfK/SrfK
VVCRTSSPRGVVVNIPEMRLYYFHPTKIEYGVPVSTFPVGLGRDDWKTPQGRFKIRGKTVNPTWNIPASIQAERVAEKGFSETSVAGGTPDNPLGKYRFELSMQGSYAIHGTNIPWGVGMQVSHGCVRLYPEDIEAMFPLVPVGTPGQFIYQPVKIRGATARSMQGAPRHLQSHARPVQRRWTSSTVTVGPIWSTWRGCGERSRNSRACR